MQAGLSLKGANFVWTGFIKNFAPTNPPTHPHTPLVMSLLFAYRSALGTKKWKQHPPMLVSDLNFEWTYLLFWKEKGVPLACASNVIFRNYTFCYLDFLCELEFNSFVVFQELISALLACSLFCLFPVGNRNDKDLPTINFDWLFAYVTFHHCSSKFIRFYLFLRRCMQKGLVIFLINVILVQVKITYIDFLFSLLTVIFVNIVL